MGFAGDGSCCALDAAGYSYADRSDDIRKARITMEMRRRGLADAGTLGLGPACASARTIITFDGSRRR
ncbi:hypothetical protein HJFPF1_10316 [Paramyrothecium foliicola]|nr:hypothetical protein HJFPF1_10316 [Paramyrothecium foliicola]